MILQIALHNKLTSNCSTSSRKNAHKSHPFASATETSRYFSYFCILFHISLFFFVGKIGRTDVTVHFYEYHMRSYVFNTHFTGSKTNIFFDVFFSVFGFEKKNFETLFSCDINLHNLIITFFFSLCFYLCKWVEKIMSYDLYWTGKHKNARFWHQQGS